MRNLSTIPNGGTRRWRDDCRGVSIEEDGVAHAVEEWEYDRRILVKETPADGNPCGEVPKHGLALIDQVMTACGLFFYMQTTERDQPTRVVTCLDCLAASDADFPIIKEEPGIAIFNTRALQRIQFSIDEDDKTK